jgi:hypothetical protein
MKPVCLRSVVAMAAVVGFAVAASVAIVLALLVAVPHHAEGAMVLVGFKLLAVLGLA